MRASLSEVAGGEGRGELVAETRDGCEPASLEYMEDPYFLPPDGDATPSFDVAVDDELARPLCNPALVVAADLPQLSDWSVLPDLADSALCIETEFFVDNRRRRLRIFRRKMREVRVTFQDLSKPYLAKVSSQANYKKFLGITTTGEDALAAEAMSPGGERPASPAAELAGLSLEEQERLKAEWSRELACIEDEITTLRTVLQSKVRKSSELKRKLGISVWKEISEDVNQGLKNVKESHAFQTVENQVSQLTKAVTDTPIYHNVESRVGQISKVVAETPVYQKTESVIKTTAEKTTSILGGITAGVSSKLGQMRNSESFRSIEERVGGVYETVKGRVASRSNSTQSFDEALRDANRPASGATSPTIPENKVLP